MAEIPDPLIFLPNGQIANVDNIRQSQLLARPNRLRAHCKVLFNGQDITNRLDPYLNSIRITDRKMGQSTCNIDLDDRYGKIPNPPDGSKVFIELGWPEEGSFKTFAGSMTDVISSGQRRSGRTLQIEATASDQLGDGKTPITGSWGEGKDAPKSSEGGAGAAQGGGGKTFGEVADEIAKKAGIKQLNIAQALKDVKRDYWSIENEPPLQWLERTAKSLGGAFKVEGENAGITDTSGKNASGEDLPRVRCKVGNNVLAWSIRPKVARAQWSSMWHGFFGRDEAKWLTESSSVEGGAGFGKAIAKHMGTFPTNDAEMAKTSGAADSVQSITGRGTGWIVIDGEPRALAGGLCEVIGARPGVDGNYTNKEVEHTYSRGGGFVSRLDVEDPELFGSQDVTGSWSKPN